MSQILVVFSSAATAEYLVAGVPAAARVLRAVSRIDSTGSPSSCVVACHGAWTPSAELIAECRRLAPRLPVEFTTYETSIASVDRVTVAGELFLGAIARTPADDRGDVLPALFEARVVDAKALKSDGRREELCLAVLRRAAKHIVASTGKTGDGIVSRLINRPISQSITHLALKSSSIRPLHATIGTAALGTAMALSLVLGGAVGLMCGAILFQCASIFDGVDGEIARATYRTSDQGAMLDSLIDALTNLVFVLGISVNLLVAGDATGACAGAAGLVMLATGLFFIGRRARACGQPINFDIIKGHLRRSRLSPALSECLIMLTMRDFFAAAGAALILIGWIHWALLAFAVVAAGWLVVSVAMLVSTARSRPKTWTCRTEMLR